MVKEEVACEIDFTNLTLKFLNNFVNNRKQITQMLSQRYPDQNQLKVKVTDLPTEKKRRPSILQRKSSLMDINRHIIARKEMHIRTDDE